ncbi:hypothetical protein [Pyxidicoccus parkwayensis]|uniref:hypothetical protein n=1 Tax=Pyxidicoccus parkwayensis TaxID=2813578 RepID=UPI001F510DCC|nr:hypothetical protein [Pyxidicoccus parkwaysis]
MKRLGAAVLVLAVGCTPLDMERRTERGPLVRTYTQQKPLGERLPYARVEAKWPTLTLHFTQADVCRTEYHEEYAEDVITTHSSRGAAAAASSGGVFTALGAGLLLGRSLFSNEPHDLAIDREGHYGASNRELATGWGTGLLILGVPALVSGLVLMSRSGETHSARKADEVVATRELPCQHQSVDGMVELAGGGGEPPAPRLTSHGTLVLTADELREEFFTNVLLDGEPVTFQEDGEDTLETFRTCALLLAQPVEPESLAREAKEHPQRLEMKRGLVRMCDALPGAPTGELLEALDVALGAE